MSEIFAMKWNLTPISTQLPEQNTQIQQDILVGRHVGCDLVLQDAKISRKHAAFYIKDHTLWLEDLQSSNGTYVNEQKIEAPTQLTGGEKIQFADLVFHLEQFQEQAVTEKPEQDIIDEAPSAEPAKAEPLSQPKATPVEDTTPQPVKKNNLQTIVFAVIAFIVAVIVWAFFK